MQDWGDGAPDGGTTFGTSEGGLVITAAALDTTTVRVTFTTPVKNNAPLYALSTYSITPALTILAVTPEVAVDPGYVDLTTNEQKDGESYTVEVHIVEAAA